MHQQFANLWAKVSKLFFAFLFAVWKTIRRKACMFCFRTVHLLSRTYFFSSQPIWYTKQEAVSRRRFATMQKGGKLLPPPPAGFFFIVLFCALVCRHSVGFLSTSCGHNWILFILEEFIMINNPATIWLKTYCDVKAELLPSFQE